MIASDAGFMQRTDDPNHPFRANIKRIFKYPSWKYPGELESSVQPTATPIQDTADTDVRMKPPLDVTFRDGLRGKVELSVVYAVPPNNAPQLIASYGSFEQAEKHLQASIYAAAFAILERYTLIEARTSRVAIQAEMLASARGAADQMGFIVKAVELGAISQTNPAPDRSASPPTPIPHLSASSSETNLPPEQIISPNPASLVPKSRLQNSLTSRPIFEAMKAAETSRDREKLPKLWVEHPLDDTLCFNSVKAGDDRMHIYFNDEPYVGLVICDVPMKGYEDFPFKKTTDRFRIRGTIKEVRIMFITLTDCIIDPIPTPTPKASP